MRWEALALHSRVIETEKLCVILRPGVEHLNSSNYNDLRSQL